MSTGITCCCAISTARMFGTILPDGSTNRCAAMPGLPKKPQGVNETLLQSLPDNGPVAMLNLVRLRERSSDGDGSGWDAYLRYSRAVMPLIKGRGGTVLWAGTADGLAFGSLGEGRWDYIVLVRY